MSKGLRIKTLRETKGITQEELAKLLDTTKQTISKYEKGIVTNIPSDKIELLSKILGTTPAYILGWDSEENDAASDLLDESLAGVTDSDQFEENKQLWISEVGTFDFTPEEMKQIIGFAKYILSQRKE